MTCEIPIFSGRTKLLVLLLFLFQLNAFSQPAIQWQKCLGGSHSDAASSIQQTLDGGYIVAGKSLSNDGDVSGNHDSTGNFTDYWIVKLDGTGSIQWQKCFGSELGDEYPYSIEQTTDSGYIIAGWTDSNGGDISGFHFGGTGCTAQYPCYDYWIVKLDAWGSLQWQKCLGGSEGDKTQSIIQTTDGGYIVAGGSASTDGDVTTVNHGVGADYWVVKLSSGGAIEWQKSYGGSGSDNANDIKQTFDGGYIIAGGSNSNDGDVSGNHGGDWWIVKIDTAGALQWQKCFGGSGDQGLPSIQQTVDSGYIIVGYTSSNDGDVSGNHGDFDYWVVKLSVSGALQWQKCLGGSSWDYGMSIQQTTDSGYIVAGWTSSHDGDVVGNNLPQPYWIVKLYGSGVIQWQKTYGGSGGDNAYSIQQTTDDGYIVAGVSGSNDGDVSGNHGGYGDYWIVKLAPYNGIKENNFNTGFSVYPNPSNGIFHLRNNANEEVERIEVFNCRGESVLYKEGKMEELNLSQSSSDIYFYKVITKKGMVFSGKLVKE